jgi:hypothetical protein
LQGKKGKVETKPNRFSKVHALLRVQNHVMPERTLQSISSFTKEETEVQGELARAQPDSKSMESGR